KTFNILSDWTGRFTGLRDEAKKITTCYTAKIGQKVKCIKKRWDEGANIDFDYIEVGLNNLRSSLIKTLTEPIKVIFHHSEEANVIQILDDINSKIDMLT